MNKKYNKSGIYKITNLINLKFYIGSTNSITNRKGNHFSLLNRSIHPNRYLQNSVNKYGIENFKFEIIEYCLEKELIEKEQYYIDIFQTYNNKIGYNLSPTAGRTVGVVCKEETKLKIGLANKERYKNGLTEEHRMKLKKSRGNTPTFYKTVYQYNKKLELIKEWISGAEAARYYKLAGSCINKAAKFENLIVSKKSKLKDYIFSYRKLTQE